MATTRRPSPQASRSTNRLHSNRVSPKSGAEGPFSWSYLRSSVPNYFTDGSSFALAASVNRIFVSIVHKLFLLTLPPQGWWCVAPAATFGVGVYVDYWLTDPGASSI
jgi:hypothetical protein